MRRDYEDLVAFLCKEIGNGLGMIVAFDEDDHEFLHGEEWFEGFVSERVTRSAEEMHRDAVSTLKQADVAGKLYDNDVRSEVRITENGTALYLFPEGREGVFVWLDPDVTIEVPTLVEEGLARVE